LFLSLFSIIIFLKTSLYKNVDKKLIKFSVSNHSRYVPVDDLYQIYKEFYKGKQEVPKLVIELCSELLYIEYLAETFAGAKIYEPFVKKAPFLLNQLDNYFLGESKLIRVFKALCLHS